MIVHGPVSLSATADRALPIDPLGRLVAHEVTSTLGSAA